MGLKGVKVNGQAYHFDHEYLENNPQELPDAGGQAGLLLTTNSNDGEPFWSSLFSVLTDGLTYSSGDVLTISDHLEWKAIRPGDDLPSYSASDRGKCLTVDNNGDLEWSTVESSSQGSDLPSYSASDNGKCLIVNDYGDLEWSAIEPSSQGSDIPPCSASDSGKCLVVNDNGGFEWAEPDTAISKGTIASALEAYEEYYENGGGMVLATSNTGSNIVWTFIADLLEYIPYNEGGDGMVLMYDGNSVYWSNV